MAIVPVLMPSRLFLSLKLLHVFLPKKNPTKNPFPPSSVFTPNFLFFIFFQFLSLLFFATLLFSNQPTHNPFSNCYLPSVFFILFLQSPAPSLILYFFNCSLFSFLFLPSCKPPPAPCYRYGKSHICHTSMQL